MNGEDEHHGGEDHISVEAIEDTLRVAPQPGITTPEPGREQMLADARMRVEAGSMRCRARRLTISPTHIKLATAAVLVLVLVLLAVKPWHLNSPATGWRDIASAEFSLALAGTGGYIIQYELLYEKDGSLPPFDPKASAEEEQARGAALNAYHDSPEYPPNAVEQLASDWAAGHRDPETGLAGKALLERARLLAGMGGGSHDGYVKSDIAFVLHSENTALHESLTDTLAPFPGLSKPKVYRDVLSYRAFWDVFDKPHIEQRHFIGDIVETRLTADGDLVITTIVEDWDFKDKMKETALLPDGTLFRLPDSWRIDIPVGKVHPGFDPRAALKQKYDKQALGTYIPAEWYEVQHWWFTIPLIPRERWLAGGDGKPSDEETERTKQLYADIETTFGEWYAAHPELHGDPAGFVKEWAAVYPFTLGDAVLYAGARFSSNDEALRNELKLLLEGASGGITAEIEQRSKEKKPPVTAYTMEDVQAMGIELYTPE